MISGVVAASDENRERLAAIARLYYLEDLGQGEIASIVGISRSQVSRLLARARELGIVRISVDEYDPRDGGLEAQLKERFGLRHAVVVRTQGGDGGGAAHVRRAIGHFGAPAVAALIKPGMTVGLAGGRTVAEVVGALPAIPGGERGVTAVQLMGNIGAAPSEIDAAELSRLLVRRYGGTYYAISAPALAQDRAMRDSFLAHEDIQSVWRLFGSLQLALVGIGSLHESAFIERGMIGTAELNRLRAAGAAGEICGRFFDASGRECDVAHRERVVGIELETLRRCDEVVAVTNGAGRASAVRAALAGKLVTSLVIDDAGARALLAPAA